MATLISRTKISRDAINNAVHTDADGFFRECDESFERRVRETVRKIAADTGRAKVIMLSGPSASGKTTTSYKLRQELGEMGIHAVAISMDDFFRGRETAPELADGSRDYESLQALDVPLLESALSDLIACGRAEVPSFNFRLGRRDPVTRQVELGPDGVAIVEGLHALDPSVTRDIPAEHMQRIYVSVSSDIIDESGASVLTARELRLIRRTVRDNRFRGSSPERTLDMWDTVCRGEDLYVRPFKKNADITLNSVFRCEPCLFASPGRELFGTVPPDSPHYVRAQHIVGALSTFMEMPDDLMPASCLLREFFGGSVYFNKSAGKKAE